MGKVFFPFFKAIYTLSPLQCRTGTSELNLLSNLLLKLIIEFLFLFYTGHLEFIEGCRSDLLPCFAWPLLIWPIRWSAPTVSSSVTRGDPSVRRVYCGVDLSFCNFSCLGSPMSIKFPPPKCCSVSCKSHNSRHVLFHFWIYFSMENLQCPGYYILESLENA